MSKFMNVIISIIDNYEKEIEKKEIEFFDKLLEKELLIKDLIYLYNNKIMLC